MLSNITILDLCVLALATSVASVTLTRSSLTKSLRRRLVPGLIRELWHCPYCMAHWIAPLLCAFGLRGAGLSLVNAAIAILAVIGLSALFMGLLMRLWLFQEGELEEMRELLNEARDELEKRQ